MSKTNHKKQTKNPSASQRRDAQERKRDERAVRNGHRKQHKDASYLADDENFAGFATQLQTIGLELRDIPGDGNCLFRALGDQFDGHSRNHLRHRADTVQYILEHRGDFEPFVEDDVPFDRHIENLAKTGTYAGNDSIVAFARRHGVNIVIHQLNAPEWRVCGSNKLEVRELHIAYHNGDHYSSVRKYGDKSQEPTKYRSSDPRKCAVAESKGRLKDRSSRSHGATAAGQDAWDTTQCNIDINDIVIQVIDATGCEDASLISDSLEENQYDLEATIDFILQVTQEDSPSAEQDASKDAARLSETGIWSPEGSGSRIFGGHVLEADKKNMQSQRTQGKGKGRGQRPTVNNRVLKQQKRLEKKERQMERHKQKVLGIQTENRDGGNDDDALSIMSVPIGQMGTLSI